MNDFDRDARMKMAGIFIKTVFAPYASGFVEIRCFGNGHNRAFYELPWTSAGLLSCARDCINQSDKRMDVYYGVLPRNAKAGRSENVREGAWVWADVDLKNTPTDALDAAIGASDIAVHSGGGAHCYKSVGRVITLGDESARFGFISACRKWQSSINAEGDNVADLPRILRVPGTWNWKNPSDPKPVRIMRFQSDSVVRPYREYSEAHPKEEEETSPLPPPVVSEQTALFVRLLVEAAQAGELPKPGSIELPSGRKTRDANAAIRRLDQNYNNALKKQDRETMDREYTDLIFFANFYSLKGSI